MPEFRCLNNTFRLSQEELDQVPDSLLAVAWSTWAGSGPVDLEAWPEPDLNVFEVTERL